MRFFFLILTLFILNSINAQGLSNPIEPIKMDLKSLIVTKNKIAAKDASILNNYNALLNKANAILKVTPKSVMDKTDIPPSGSKHDYVSLAPYWWPDTLKPKGLPYIKKDGLINPEVKNFPDKEHMPILCENVYLLGLVYYFSEDEKYAQKASELLSVWFIDTATKMNPNLNFAQMVKGINNGRGTGIIDTRHFVYAIDGIKLIENSKYWDKYKSTTTKKWFSDFLNWMLHSENGVEELQTKNNHGVWFDAQALGIALYVDSIKLAGEIIKRSLNRLDQQSNEAHLFPLELERTNSLHYSCFNLLAFSVIAQLAENIGMNYWEIETIHHHSLHKAYDAILPYLNNEKKWTYPEITPFNPQDAYVTFYYANRKLNCDSCLSAIKKSAGEQYQFMLMHLL
jgi:Alginate lyase